MAPLVSTAQFPSFHLVLKPAQNFFFFFFFYLAESFFYRKWPRAKIREAFGTLVSSVSSLIIKYDKGEMCSVMCDAFVTSWTVAHQAPGSTGSSRQEYWNGLPCPPPGDLPDPGIESTSLCLLHWLVDSLPLAPPAKPNKGEKRKWSRSVVSDSSRPHGLSPTRLLRPWDFPGKSTGVGCHFLLQEIFLTQGSNPCLPHCRQTLYCLNHQGSHMFAKET